MLRADGQAAARLRNAEAEAQAIKQISEAITTGQGNPAQYLLMQRYIESLTNMATSTNAKVVFMPVETSSVLSSVGALKEVFGEIGGQRESVDYRGDHALPSGRTPR